MNGPFVTLHQIGLDLHDPSLPTPLRITLIRRGRQWAEDNGIEIVTVGRRGFVRRADYDRITGVAA